MLQKHTLWFLHLLLFIFSYCLCLPRHIRAGPIGPDPEMQILARSCELWMNGIYWENYDDKVELIVEVTEHHRCITVVTSMNDIEKSRKIFNDVVQTILTLKSQMHIFKREEYLIGPSDVGNARSLLINERTIYNIKDVARSVLTKGNVRDNKDTETVGVEEIVGVHDPFLCIVPSVTKALFGAKLSLQGNYLQHIVNRFLLSHFH